MAAKLTGAQVNSNPLVLTWDELDKDIHRLARMLRRRKFKAFYGVPRGGLIIAVRLSHLLNKPVVMEPVEGCIVVDDVNETGTTLSSYIDKHPVVVLYQKPWTDFPVQAAFETTRWIQFPYETINSSKMDYLEEV